jgi:hypothetical protein
MLLPIPDKIVEIKARLFSDGKLHQENALIKVLNGTPTPDYGESFAAFLRSQGIPKDRIIVDELAGGILYEQSLIVNHQEKDYTTAKIAEWLGFNVDFRSKRFEELQDELRERFKDPTVGITVVLGDDAIIPDSPADTFDYPAANGSYDYEEPVEEEEYTPYTPPEDTPAPEPEPTAEPAPEPEPTAAPEPTTAPEQPAETPAVEGGQGNGTGNGNGNGGGRRR